MQQYNFIAGVQCLHKFCKPASLLSTCATGKQTLVVSLGACNVNTPMTCWNLVICTMTNAFLRPPPVSHVAGDGRWVNEVHLKTSASGDGSYSRQTSKEDIGLAECRDVDASTTALGGDVLCRTDRRARTGRALHCRDRHVSSVAACTAEILPPVACIHAHTGSLL